MSLPTHELLRTISSSQHHHDSIPSEESQRKFRKLLEVNPVDERLSDRSLFSLIEEEEEEESLEAVASPPPQQLLKTITPGDSTKATSMLSATVEALFEKMASRMIVMDRLQETHTSFFLDQPQFANSSFFGTQITIKEFSTAPKAFNIEIISNPTAIAFIQKQQQSLLAVFAQSNFNFTVHRLETQIMQELEPRYEEGEQGQQEQQKDPHS